MSQINIKEISRRIKASMPGRAVCVKAAYWCHHGRGEQVELQVSLLPGLDGTECSIATFSTAAELLAWVDETIENR